MNFLKKFQFLEKKIYLFIIINVCEDWITIYGEFTIKGLICIENGRLWNNKIIIYIIIWYKIFKMIK